MKDYHEMAESVLARRDRYAAERKRRRRRWGAALCCLVLTVLAGVGLWRMDMTGQNDRDNGAEQGDGRDGARYELFGTESSPDGAEEQGEVDPAADAPVQDGAETGTPKDDGFDAVWGGSYLDESGKWVVWLTENTPENQTAVFEQNPTLPESSTLFRTADYSLSYLTALLERISDGMRDGKLPFVSSAAVMESRNCVEVTVSTEDEKTLAPLRRFDTLGGALELRYAAASGKEELAAAE